MDVGTHYRQMMNPLPILSPALSNEVSPQRSSPTVVNNPPSSFEMTPMWGESSATYYKDVQNPRRSEEIDRADEVIESHLKRKRAKDTVELLESLSVKSPHIGTSSPLQILTPSDSQGAVQNEQPPPSSPSVVGMEPDSPRADFSPDFREAMLPSRPVHYDNATFPSEAVDDVEMAQPDSPRPTSTSPLIIPWPRLSAFRPPTRRSRHTVRPRSPSPEEMQLQPHHQYELELEQQQPIPAAAVAPTTVQQLQQMLLKRGAARDGDEGPEEKRMRGEH